jgi:hypothetical protein
MEKHKRLWDLYRFLGFSPEHTVSGIFGDPHARVLGLVRRGKKVSVEAVVRFTMLFTIERFGGSGTFPAVASAFFWNWKSAESLVAGAEK